MNTSRRHWFMYPLMLAGGFCASSVRTRAALPPSPGPATPPVSGLGRGHSLEPPAKPVTWRQRIREQRASAARTAPAMQARVGNTPPTLGRESAQLSRLRGQAPPYAPPAAPPMRGYGAPAPRGYAPAPPPAYPPPALAYPPARAPMDPWARAMPYQGSPRGYGQPSPGFGLPPAADPWSQPAPARGGYGGYGAYRTPSPAPASSPDHVDVPQNPKVVRYVRFFTRTHQGRKLFVKWLRRAGMYEEIISQALRNHHLPQELQAIAYIESGLSPIARSHAGAVGMWQFMEKTGRAYGLRIGRTYDERRNVWAASEAAAQHLADLFERYHNWELVIAAYNLGYSSLERRMAELGTHNFWDLSSVDGSMPGETARYVPKVMAAMVVLKHLRQFDFSTADQEPPLRVSPLKVPGGVRLSLVARAAGTSLRRLRKLNPEFRRSRVPKGFGLMTVHIPSEGLARAQAMLPRLLSEKGNEGRLDTKVSSRFDWGNPQASPGKTGGSKGALSDRRQAREGKPEVAGSGSERLLATRGRSRKRKKEFHWRGNAGEMESENNVLYYRIGAGETLASIGKQFGISPVRILAQNQYSQPVEPPVGTLLRLEVKPSVLRKFKRKSKLAAAKAAKRAQEAAKAKTENPPAQPTAGTGK